MPVTLRHSDLLRRIGSGVLELDSRALAIVSEFRSRIFASFIAADGFFDAIAFCGHNLHDVGVDRFGRVRFLAQEIHFLHLVGVVMGDLAWVWE